MGKRELIALLNLSSWCLVIVERLFLEVPRGSLQFVIVVFHDHTHLLFFTLVFKSKCNFEKLILLFGYFIIVARTNFQKLDDGERFVQSRSG